MAYSMHFDLMAYIMHICFKLHLEGCHGSNLAYLVHETTIRRYLIPLRACSSVMPLGHTTRITPFSPPPSPSTVWFSAISRPRPFHS